MEIKEFKEIMNKIISNEIIGSGYVKETYNTEGREGFLSSNIFTLDLKDSDENIQTLTIKIDDETDFEIDLEDND